ncbi:MAG: FMN-binding protein [Bacillota bacterium]
MAKKRNKASLCLAVCTLAIVGGASLNMVQNDVILSTELGDIIAIAEDGALYTQTVRVDGYHPNIVMTVAIDTQTDTVAKIDILQHAETPDYGGHITERWFLDRFAEKSVDTPFGIVKIMPDATHDVVAITGATISSEAIAGGVNLAMEYYRNSTVRSEEFLPIFESTK